MELECELGCLFQYNNTKQKWLISDNPTQPYFQCINKHNKKKTTNLTNKIHYLHLRFLFKNYSTRKMTRPIYVKKIYYLDRKLFRT